MHQLRNLRRRMPDFGDRGSVTFAAKRGHAGLRNIELPAVLFMQATMAKRFLYYVFTAFSSAAKAIALIVLCVLVGCAVTFPLWRFATSLPSVYTAVVLSLFAAYILYKIAHAIKKSTRKTVLCIVLNIVIIASGLTAAVALVFAGARFIAIPVIILIPVLCIISSRLLRGDQ